MQACRSGGAVAIRESPHATGVSRCGGALDGARTLVPGGQTGNLGSGSTLRAVYNPKLYQTVEKTVTHKKRVVLLDPLKKLKLEMKCIILPHMQVSSAS